VQQISQDIAVCGEELARERVCKLLHETWKSPEQMLKELREANAKEDEDEEEPVDAEDEISCVISNKLRLRCPLSFERVVIPVRGESCMHLQCFGLGAYLESNVKMRSLNNRWTCPVCGVTLRPRDLRLDGYVAKVLADTPDHVDEVVILPGGDIKWVEGTQEERDEEAQNAVAARKQRHDTARGMQRPKEAGDSEMVDGDGKEASGEIGDDGAGTKRKEAPDVSPLESRKLRKGTVAVGEEEAGENASAENGTSQPEVAQQAS